MANLHSLNFSQLIRFLELAEELHFTRAAEKLGIAQPLLSEQIKALEYTTGVKLFERTSRRVELTAAGKTFRDRARLIVQGIQDGITAAQETERGQKSRLRIGYTDEYAGDFLPKSIRHIKETQPTADIELTFGLSPHLTELLQTGLIDAALVCPIPDDPLGPEYSFIPLKPLPLSVALPLDHPLSREKELKIPDLKDEPLIEGPQAPLCASERVVNRLFSRYGLERIIAQRVSEHELGVSLVTEKIGLMIGYFSHHTRIRDDIAIVPLADSEAVLTRAVFWRKVSRPPLIESLLEFMDKDQES